MSDGEDDAARGDDALAMLGRAARDRNLNSSGEDSEGLAAEEADHSGIGGREAGAALHERGEKLETLKSRVDGLAAESEDFATMAHRLNMQARDGKC